MKKNALLSYITLGVGVLLFNVLAFVIPSLKTATFYTAYVFTMLAFVAQIPLWILAFGNKETLKSKFLGIPLIYVGLLYLAVQLVAFSVFMIFSTLPVWSAILVCSVILALTLIFVIAGKAAENEITRVEKKANAKRAFLQLLQTDIEMLAEIENDTQAKSELLSLAEKVRFSDPMSNEMLAQLEARILANVEKMKMVADKKSLIIEIEMLLTERNKKCKILK